MHNLDNSWVNDEVHWRILWAVYITQYSMKPGPGGVLIKSVMLNSQYSTQEQIACKYSTLWKLNFLQLCYTHTSVSRSPCWCQYRPVARIIRRGFDGVLANKYSYLLKNKILILQGYKGGFVRTPSNPPPPGYGPAVHKIVFIFTLLRTSTGS